MDAFLWNHLLYLLCRLLGVLASQTLAAVDAVSNWWHAAACIALALLPKARTTFPVTRPAPGFHPGVLVTGTSSGIGHDLAVALAARGYTVFAGVRSWEDGARVEAGFLASVGGDKLCRDKPCRDKPCRDKLCRDKPCHNKLCRNAGVRPDKLQAEVHSGHSSGEGSDKSAPGARARRQRRRRPRTQAPRAETNSAEPNSLEPNSTETKCETECGTSGSVVPVILDVASAESIDAAFEVVAAQLRRRRIPLAGVVNNAGVTAFAPMDVSAPALVDDCLAVNFRGPVRVAQRFMPLLRAARGRIVNTSSVMAWLVGPGFGAYCASKAALSAASRAWRYELAADGVAVSVLEPGITRTALWPKLEAQLEVHHARLNGRRPLPADAARYSPMVRRIRASNGLAPAFALPTRHAVAAALHALTSRYPKATYRVGWDARLLSLATWVASDEVVEWACRAIGIVSES